MSKLPPLMIFMIGHRIAKFIRKIVNKFRPLPPDPCPIDY